MKKDLLKSILDEQFLETIAKSADLYKIGTNSVLDPEEIRIGLKVVPRAVMSMLISELTPMEINSHKDIHLPFGKEAFVRINKNASDDYTGSVYSDNKIVYDFKNRSIPGLGIILLSTFELYDIEELEKPNTDYSSDVQAKVQKLIDERMELHSLVSRVVEEKLSQREAIHKIMMSKLSDAMKAAPIASEQKPIEVKTGDIIKKEAAPKKGSPLKEFIERKKKPKEYHVEMAKSESVDCESCGHTIFGHNLFSCCICYGEDRYKKIWIKKSEKGIIVKFSKSWNPDNIEILLECLRKKNE